MAKKDPEHFWSVAVQDVLTSSIRARALRLGRPDLWALYLEILLRTKEQGAPLPADPEALADLVGFWSPEQLAEMLPLLRPAPGSRGGVVIQGDHLHQPRIAEDDAERYRFSQTASAMGKARAAQATRGPDGRMQPKASQSPAAAPAEPQRQTSATRAANGPPEPLKSGPLGIVSPTDDPSVHQPTTSDTTSGAPASSSSPYPYPSPTPSPTDPETTSAAVGAGGAKGGQGGKRKRPVEPDVRLVDGKAVLAEPATTPPTAPPAPNPASGVVVEEGGLRWNPNRPEEDDFAREVLAITALLADADTPPIAIQEALSGTADGGKVMDEILGAPAGWLRTSLWTGVRFREENGLPPRGGA